MKLNIKKTCLIGLAFLTIMMLWQVYNWYVPLFLNDFLEGLFDGDEIVIGAVMGLDNLFAVFMIPLMSRLSDKSKSKFGKRTPFIIIGITLSALTFLALPFANKTNKIWLLLTNIFLILVSMNIYRSPCVSLMADITPKSLRNKGNSIINVFGGIGVAIGYLMILIFYKKENLSEISNFIPFIAVCTIMLLILSIFLALFKEVRFVNEYKQELIDNNISYEEDQKEDPPYSKKPKTDKANVFLVLLVVFFVYMANNAVESWLSLYSADVFTNTINLPSNLSPDSLPMACFGIGTFGLAIPAAIIADRIGRKKAILIGIIGMLSAYLAMSIIGFTVGFSLAIVPVFIIGGAGFSLISINIYPLVVENCSNDQIGVYTGKYYTSNMLAQSITPALCGLVVSNLLFDNMKALFPYCTVFMVFALITLLFIKEEK